MAQKWVDQSSSSTLDRLPQSSNGSCQLSDGTLVWLDTDGTSVYLKYSSDHSTTNTIATLSGFSSTVPSWNVCRDASDNLYVVASPPSTFATPAQAFTKGAGHTWTARSSVTWGSGSPASWASVVWCNTGGGTGGAGHLLVIGGLGYAILDAGKMLAGTTAQPVNYSGSATFLGTVSATIMPTDTMLSPDGFGATNGICVTPSSTAGKINVGSWSVSVAGALGTNALITSTLSSATLSISTRIRVVRTASNLWAIIFPSATAGHYACATFNATGAVTATADSGTPASMPLNSAALTWDAFCDPVTANKAWVIATTAISGSTVAVYRLSVSTASGIVWSTTTTTDDTLTGLYSSVTDVANAVTQPVSTYYVDWMAFVQTAITTYGLYGDSSLFPTAPSAPTLTAPANAAYVDVATIPGVTFSGIDNSTDTTAANARALRMKISGAGSYSYWNQSTLAWQSTIVWNPVTIAPGASGSFGPITATLADATVINWSMADQESGANLQGPFASDFVANLQAVPTLTITGPTGTVANTNIPTLVYVPTVPSGASVVAGRWLVYPQAVTLITGFTIAIGAGTIPGGAVSDVSWTGNPLTVAMQAGVQLAGGATYVAYAAVQESGGQWSATISTTFTEALDLPAISSVTATVGTDPATGAARIAVAVQAIDNWLSAIQASSAGGLTTGWTAWSNTTLSTTVTNPEDGSTAFLLTATAIGTVNAGTPLGTSGFPVTPGQQVRALAGFRAPATARQCSVYLYWWTASGSTSTVRASDASAAITDSTTGYVQASISNTAPSDAAFASVAVYVVGLAASETVQVGEVLLGPGTVSTSANPLSADDASFEGGTGTWGLGTWGHNNCTIAQTTAQALDGTHSLAVTATGVTDIVVGMAGLGYPVAPNTVYTAVFSSRAATTARAPYIQLIWFNAAGGVISSPTSTPVSDTTTGWTQVVFTATSPSNAAFAMIRPYYPVNAVGEVHYVDCVALVPGTSTTWTPGQPPWTRGGLVGSTTATVLRSDGLYVRGASPATPLAIPSPGQLAVVYDYETTPGVAYTYTAVVSALLGVGSQISGAASAASGSATVTLAQPDIMDPLDPSTAVLVQYVGDSIVRDEPEVQGILRPFGRSTAMVIRGDMLAVEFDLALQFYGDADASWKAFKSLRERQHTVMLRGDMTGDLWYVALGSARPMTLLRTSGRISQPVRGVVVHCTPVDRPPV